MLENRLAGKEPLWKLIETQIQGFSDADFSDAKRLQTARTIAAKLDQGGYNVSKSGGNWLQLKFALKARNEVGRPFMQDLDKAVAGLSLENIGDTELTAMAIMRDLGGDWPAYMASEYRADVKEIVADRRTELTVAAAKEVGGEKGIRYLLAEDFSQRRIMKSLGISAEEYNAVKAKVDAEVAEKKRVQGLFAEMAEASSEDAVKHLIKNNAADELIIEIAGVAASAVDEVRKLMEEEMAEQKRRAEEEAARKAAEAAGPALEDIPADELLEYIEGIREIMEFSDVEDEIRAMCEQSNYPKSLVDVAVSDPDKLDELETQAGG